MGNQETQTRYYRGQGKVYLSERTPEGKPVGFKWLGNCTELSIKPKTDKIQKRESYTGNQSVELEIEKMLDADLSMNICSMAKDNLKRMVFGTSTDKGIRTVTEEALIATGGTGQSLEAINVTNFASLTDDGGTTTYTLGTDYTVDLQAGFIEFPDSTTIPAGSTVKANYEAGASEVVSAFTKPNQNYYLLFNGLNTAEGNNPVKVRAFKVRFGTMEELPLINNEDVAEYKQEGTILIDPCQPANGVHGQYFSEEMLPQAA